MTLLGKNTGLEWFALSWGSLGLLDGRQGCRAWWGWYVCVCECVCLGG